VTLALVLGGGGLAGIAWHTGLLAGLARAGADPTGADLVVGTSAGSTVGALVAEGRALEDLLAHQLDPATAGTELRSPVPMDDLIARLAPIYTAGLASAERRRRLGELAVATDTVPESARRAVMLGRGVTPGWPGRALWITVVDARTGDRRVLDRASGVDLVDAVAASSAVPGVWPPVTLDGTRYVDGGVWSLCNADLAAGYDRVLVLAPLADPSVAREVDGLGPGVAVEVVTPDEASTAAFGTDVLDPAVREPSARAGLAQAAAEADRVRALLAG